MLRNLIVGACVCLLLASGASATPYAGEFLATGIGARALGLGGAFVAVVDDASATYWNAAALPRNEMREIMYMHSERFGDLVNYDAGALVFRTRESSNGAKSAFGLGFVMVSVPNISFTTTDRNELKEIEVGLEDHPDTTLDGNGRLDPGERINFDLLNLYATEVTDRQLGAYLSYGRTQVFHPNLSIGGSAKFVRKSVGDFSAWGLGLDLAALYQVRTEWTVGMNLQDITTTFLDWGFPADYTGGRNQTVEGSREYITPTVKVGTAWKQPVERLSGSITVALDFDVRFEDEQGSSFTMGSTPADVHAGVEYWYRDTLAFRVGSERLGGDTDPFTAGAGIRVKRLSFDYAYRNHTELDDVHRLSGGVLF